MRKALLLPKSRQKRDSEPQTYPKKAEKSGCPWRLLYCLPRKHSRYSKHKLKVENKWPKSDEPSCLKSDEVKLWDMRLWGWLRGVGFIILGNNRDLCCLLWFCPMDVKVWISLMNRGQKKGSRNVASFLHKRICRVTSENSLWSPLCVRKSPLAPLVLHMSLLGEVSVILQESKRKLSSTTLTL